MAPGPLLTNATAVCTAHAERLGREGGGKSTLLLFRVDICNLEERDSRPALAEASLQYLPLFLQR